MLEINKIYCGDCLEVMKEIDDKSIDMILCDLPYGITACKWDIIIPFEPLWTQYKRIIKDNGAIVLTASQPFTTKLINSNFEMFKYDLVWDKVCTRNFYLAKKRFLTSHENILVFYQKQPTYNPQLREGAKGNFGIRSLKPSQIYGNKNDNYNTCVGYPKSILTFRSPINLDKDGNLHPTQKPVALFEYLIKTYTNENELVLDNCIGSGTTAIACLQTNRNFIGIEIEPKYVEIANKRINEFKKQLTLIK